MIFDLHREAFIRGIQGRAARYGPGLENPVELESQIVVKAPRSMFLNDKTQTLVSRNLPSTARLRRLLEIALRAIL
jgi:hypothetical protein